MADKKIVRTVNEIAQQIADWEIYADDYLADYSKKKSRKEKIEHWQKWLTDKSVK